MKKKLIFLSFILIFLALVLYFIFSQKEDKSVLTLFGNIEIRQVDLSFQVEGKILKLLKEEGDEVKSGELVAILDNRDYLTEYKKSYMESKRAKAISDDAKWQYEHKSPLCSDGTISQLECEGLLNRKNETKASYEVSVALKEEAKNRLDYTKIYSPDEGIITTRIKEPGSVVKVSEAVYTLSKNKPVWIRAYIPENQLGNVRYGMKADILTDSTNPETKQKRKYKGYVGFISPVAEFTPKTVQTQDLRTDLVYRIRVYIYENDKFLRQGMPVTIKIDMKQEDGSKVDNQCS